MKTVTLKSLNFLFFSLLIIFLLQSSDMIISFAAEYHYLYGCTKYVPGFNCDPIKNEFEGSIISAEYTKKFSPTREPVFTDNDTGKALVLKANALESLTVNNRDILNSEKFSIYLNVIPQNTENSFSSIISFTGDPHVAGWDLNLVPTDDPTKKIIRFTVFNTDGVSFSVEDSNVSSNRYIEVIGTFDGKKIKLFLDGNLKSETEFSGFYNSNPGFNIPLKFGGGSYCSCNTASVIIDEIRFFKNALDDDSIANIKLNQNKIASDSLIGYWKFDGDIKDYSGFSNDAFYNTIIASMVFTPDGKLIYTEKNTGIVRVIKNERIEEKPFATISDVYVDWEQGLLGITLDSKFAENNYLYIYYNYKEEHTGEIFSRVVRYTDINDEGKEPFIILDKIPASHGFHTGGAIAFNQNDDKLYVFVGDGTIRENAQDISLFYGKILRVNRDGTIPKDNPFSNSPVFTYGHRNSYGLSFDNLGNGILAESGPETYDEINLIEKGGNYGWPTLQMPNISPESFTNNTSIKPIRSYFQPPSPTQTIFYDHTKFQDLKDKFIFGTVRGTLFSLQLDPETRSLKEEIKIDLRFYPYQPVISIASSPDGELYFAGYEIYKLESLNFENKQVSMYPVEINSTNVSVSQLKFYDKDKRLDLYLEDKLGPSKLLIKIPKSMIPYDEEINLTSQTTLASDEKTVIDLPHTIQSISKNDHNIITFDIPHDYPTKDNLKLVLGESKIIVTKTVPEFDLLMIVLMLPIIVLLILSKLSSKLNNLSFNKLTQ